MVCRATKTHTVSECQRQARSYTTQYHSCKGTSEAPLQTLVFVEATVLYRVRLRCPAGGIITATSLTSRAKIKHALSNVVIKVKATPVFSIIAAIIHIWSGNHVHNTTYSFWCCWWCHRRQQHASFKNWYCCRSKYAYSFCTHFLLTHSFALIEGR